MGLRFASPALGLILGFGSCDWDKGKNCNVPDVHTTFGIAIASIIDAALLADDLVEERFAGGAIRRLCRHRQSKNAATSANVKMPRVCIASSPGDPS